MPTTLTHPLTGLPILSLGCRRNGAPIWPIIGAAEDDDTDADESTDEDATDDADEADEDAASDSEDEADDTDDDGSDDLGDAGKQALSRMKAKVKAERAKRRDVEQKLAQKAEDGEDTTRESEAITKANARILRSEVKAQAAGKLADPMDAHRFLDLDSFEVDDDGNVDEDEIADAIDDLIKEKPYLAAQGGRRFKGSADGGARKDARPKQVSRGDLSRMTPEQINKAREDGRLDTLMGVQH